MQVMRDPVGVISKANFIYDGMFSSLASSSASCASNEADGIHSSELQEPSPFLPSASQEVLDNTATFKL